MSNVLEQPTGTMSWSFSAQVSVPISVSLQVTLGNAARANVSANTPPNIVVEEQQQQVEEPNNLTGQEITAQMGSDGVHANTLEGAAEDIQQPDAVVGSLPRDGIEPDTNSEALDVGQSVKTCPIVTQEAIQRVESEPSIQVEAIDSTQDKSTDENSSVNSGTSDVTLLNSSGSSKTLNDDTQQIFSDFINGIPTGTDTSYLVELVKSLPGGDTQDFRRNYHLDNLDYIVSTPTKKKPSDEVIPDSETEPESDIESGYATHSATIVPSKAEVMKTPVKRKACDSEGVTSPNDSVTKVNNILRPSKRVNLPAEYAGYASDSDHSQFLGMRMPSSTNFIGDPDSSQVREVVEKKMKLKRRATQAKTDYITTHSASTWNGPGKNPNLKRHNPKDLVVYNFD